jgi:energy-coupling factor transporter transmembrane protein EcfT
MDDRKALRIGIPARLGLFAWSLVLVLLTPPASMAWVAGVCALVNITLYPQALRHLANWRWLVLFGGLILSNALLLGEKDRLAWFVPYSAEGVSSGVQMALRGVVMILALDGLASSVEVAELAGLLERFGLKGLGFSVGIAMNLLPLMRQSALNAWQSLWMRGGLRRKWRRGLRFYLVTVLSNAIRRAEEIALAAEARAYSPGRLRPWPLRRGSLDWLVLASVLISAAAIMLVTWL